MHIWESEWGRAPAAHLEVGVGKGPGCTSDSWSGEGARLHICKLEWGRGSAAHLEVGVGKGPGWSSVSWPWRKVEILLETQKGNSRPQNVFRETLKYAIPSFRDQSINLSKNLEILTNGTRRLGVGKYVDIQS